MKEDLQGLEISSQEVKELSGCYINLNEKVKLSDEEIEFLPMFLASIFMIWLIGFLGAQLFGMNLTYNIRTISIIGGLSLILTITYFIINEYEKRIGKSVIHSAVDLKNLVDEIQKFNSIVKSIDVKDQLAEAGGGKEMEAEERKNVMDALSLTREDLIRGLRIERILRENRSVIESNSNMFQNNLSSIEALKIKEKATEASNLIGETLQVSVEVQNQINQLMQKPD